jgi:glycosyltransferase involved in cell wall biosynthesis
MPRVTVIIPAHNAERHIGEALQSVARQTYSDWEAVVADDASSDDTAGVVATFAPRAKLARSDRNLGPADARNLAISQASGELLAFLDADDQWLPDYLEQLVRLYDESSQAAGDGVGIVACDAFLLEDDGRPAGTYAERFGSHEAVTLTSLLKANSMLVCSLAPRAVVEEVGGFSNETFGTEDYDLWLRIVERGYQVVKTRKPLVVVRLAREGSVSNRLGGMARSFQATYRRALARGNLTPAQSRLARRQLQFYEAVEQLAAFLDDRGDGREGAYRRLFLNLPLFFSVVVRSPHRLPRWTWRLATGRLGG